MRKHRLRLLPVYRLLYKGHTATRAPPPRVVKTAVAASRILPGFDTPSLKQTTCVEIHSVQGLGEGGEKAARPEGRRHPTWLCGLGGLAGGSLASLILEVLQNRTITQQGCVSYTAGKDGESARPSEALLLGERDLPTAHLWERVWGTGVRRVQRPWGWWRAFQRGCGCCCGSLPKASPLPRCPAPPGDSVFPGPPACPPASLGSRGDAWPGGVATLVSTRWGEPRSFVEMCFFQST